MLLKTIRNKFLNPAVLQQSHRQIFEFLNTSFNALDEERKKQVGANRTCAEWILRNGGKVKFAGETNFRVDYNSLPPEDTKLQITDIDASKCSINHIGFVHFAGCSNIKSIIFHKCVHLEDEALPLLSPLKTSLTTLVISNCKNITDTGLKELKVLTNLKSLTLENLPYVKNKEDVETFLKKHLTSANIQMKV